MKRVKLIILSFFIILGAVSNAQAEIKSCQDIQASKLKEILFLQIEKDIVNLKILGPIVYDGNIISNKKEDDILRAKWIEFKNRSKLSIKGDVLEEQYDNPKICTYTLNLQLINNPPSGYSNLEIYPSFVVRKNALSKLFDFDNINISKQNWLRMNATLIGEKKYDVLAEIMLNFRSFLVFEGFFNDRSVLSKNVRQSLFTILHGISFFNGYYEYFEKNYSKIDGNYQELMGEKNALSVKIEKNNQVSITTKQCLSVQIIAIKNKPFSYEGMKNELNFDIYFDPDFLYIENSQNKCLKDGKYYYFGKNY